MSTKWVYIKLLNTIISIYFYSFNYIKDIYIFLQIYNAKINCKPTFNNTKYMDPLSIAMYTLMMQTKNIHDIGKTN